MPSIQNGLILQYRLLALIVAKGFRAEQQLKENDTDTPYVYFVRYLRTVLVEALGCLVPVGAHALGRQLDPLGSLVHDLAEAKVRDLDLPIVKDNVLWFQVEVYYLLFALVQVFQAAQNLRYDQLSFLLMNLLVLLQIEVQVRARAQLQYGAEAVVIDLHGIVLVHYSAVVQVLVNLVLSDGVLDVVVLDLLGPAVVEVVDLAGHLAAVLQIEGLVDLGVPALAEDA